MHSDRAWSEKYICVAYNSANSPQDHWCPSWRDVIANKDKEDWGYQIGNPLKNRLSIIKISALSTCSSITCNPLVMTLKNPQLNDTGEYILGSYEDRKDPVGKFIIQVSNKTIINERSNSQTINFGTLAKNITLLTMQKMMEIETGFAQKNYSLDWIISTARVANKENCVVCSSARPALLTVPSPFSDN